MNQPTKTIFIFGFILSVYGYLCRELKIYFFWDSKSFGWIIILIGVLILLLDINRKRKIQGRKTFWVKIGIGVMIFGFILGGSIIFSFKNSEPYQTAIDYLNTNEEIKNEIGQIKGLGLIPSGSIQEFSSNGVESGVATFYITILGNKKFKDVEITLKKHLRQVGILLQSGNKPHFTASTAEYPLVLLTFFL